MKLKPSVRENNDAEKCLRDKFFFSEFRDSQFRIIDSILNGHDIFVSMPTGAGKSLCYQIPACLLEGTAVVISPLISLMKDQVDKAVSRGIKAVFLNSSMDSAGKQIIYEKLLSGQTDIIYTAPERFSMINFREILRKIKISFFAIDEAHCISEWGADFRPDYLNLSSIKNDFPEIRIAAFTASATLQVQKDIIKKLQMQKPLIIRNSFNRENLFYEVRTKHDADSQILEIIKSMPVKSGIVYRTSRKSTEKTAWFLRQNGIRAAEYHAGLDNETRKDTHDKFLINDINIVVATIAFGMGIDKPDIRFIIHGDLPKNMEGYYQETGRAGRDGLPAKCILLFNRGDIPKLKYFISQIENENEKSKAYKKLDIMMNYALSSHCRRKKILNYFDEAYTSENCGMCDICTRSFKKKDSTRDAQLVIKAIKETGERFGAAHISNILKGADTKKIRNYNHQILSSYGTGSHEKTLYWRDLIDEMIIQHAVSQTPQEYTILKITEHGRNILTGKEAFFVNYKPG
ncbi:MAG: ATP-dependent DNA helicase RecQ [Spirochaetes bacterium]|nr:ATP-dependent DNA helicase RecQ [Spirochaetota bacterium]